MPFVYILGTSTPRGPISYVGWTLDLERRLAQHNAGKGARTTRGRVWSLLHSESFETREDAMSREWYLKRDRKFRKELLRGACYSAAAPGKACSISRFCTAVRCARIAASACAALRSAIATAILRWSAA